MLQYGYGAHESWYFSACSRRFSQYVVKHSLHLILGLCAPQALPRVAVPSFRLHRLPLTCRSASHHIETHCLVLSTYPRPVKVMCFNMVPGAGIEPINKFMPTLYTLTCNHCNQDFTVSPRNKKRKFCSNICFKLFSRNDEILDNCLNCHISLNRRIQKKFCSSSCSSLFNNRRRSKESRQKQSTTLRKTLAKNNLARTDEKEIYYSKCSFKSWDKSIWIKLPGYSLIAEIGIYHPITNPNGAVRDHIVSKYFGWKNSVDPEIISHPANCRIISNMENIKKGKRSDLSLNTLLESIKKWCG